MSACEIAEIMIFDRQISDSERMKLEGSLAHKWGIESDILEASHPYYVFTAHTVTSQADYAECSCNVLVEMSLTSGQKWGTVMTGLFPRVCPFPPMSLPNIRSLPAICLVLINMIFSVATTPSPPVPESNANPKPDVSQLINRKVVSSWNNTFYIDENGSLRGCGCKLGVPLGIGDHSFRTQFEKVITGNVASVSTRITTHFSLRRMVPSGEWDEQRRAIGDRINWRWERAFPMKVMDHGVIDTAVGTEHTLFLKYDGSLWGMGKNHEGQLGIGNYDRQSSPF